MPRIRSVDWTWYAMQHWLIPSHHLFTHAGNLILHQCFFVLDPDQLPMSHAVDFIYLKTAPCCCAVHFFPNTQLPTHVVFFRQSLETSRSSHFPSYHVSVFWIMSSTCHIHFPRCPLPPSLTPPVTPWSTFFHILNRLCQLLVIIDIGN